MFVFLLSGELVKNNGYILPHFFMGNSAIIFRMSYVIFYLIEHAKTANLCNGYDDIRASSHPSYLSHFTNSLRIS